MSKKFKYECDYFITFCTTYKMEILNDKIQEELKNFFIKECKKDGYNLKKVNITPCSVMLEISFPPTVSGQAVIGKLKRQSVSLIKELDPGVKTKLPSIWTNNYFIQTVGEKNIEKALEFISTQKTRKLKSN